MLLGAMFRSYFEYKLYYFNEAWAAIRSSVGPVVAVMAIIE